ncbi:endonuclease VII domain-containing protein [Nonomuraea lactucae]|uniref:endonuclease VII domain-containing protein n=1 Tax=Nonomuraea lactucae TaxID=2249762 RepID=UPI000DE44788|nr:endonuclease VII domain-containing protein [Nonomuraea lactucae]
MSERTQDVSGQEAETAKLCPGCEQVKPLTAFGIRRGRGGQRIPRCRDCMNAAKRAWYQRNREVVADYQRKYEKRTGRRASLKKYGLRPQDFDALVEAQNGVCAACNEPQAQHASYLDVDHCHKTGRVRGLLCRRCNKTIGLAKEDPLLLLGLAAYLRRSSAVGLPTGSVQ